MPLRYGSWLFLQYHFEDPVQKRKWFEVFTSQLHYVRKYFLGCCAPWQTFGCCWPWANCCFLETSSAFWKVLFLRDWLELVLADVRWVCFVPIPTIHEDRSSLWRKVHFTDHNCFISNCVYFVFLLKIAWYSHQVQPFHAIWRGVCSSFFIPRRPPLWANSKELMWFWMSNKRCA